VSGVGFSGLDASNPTPLYHQIYLDFRHRILAGILRYGQRLPSEAVIAQELGVSRITVKRAMNDLAKEGMVIRNRGRGTIVSYRPPVSPDADGFAGLVEGINSIAETTSIDVLSIEYVTPPAQIAMLMNLPETAQTQRVERRRSRNGEPFSYIVSYVPDVIGRTLDETGLSAHPILHLIEASGHRIASARQRVTSQAASPLVAQILMVPVGAPLLKVSRLVRDDAGQPVQCVDILYRPDMYQLEMDLRRGDDHDGRRVWSAVE
jgi:GntR family transcriptional regulator